MNAPARIAFFGSSLLSAYWNGAATYYRGLLKALHGLGYQITFYEPDAFSRQQNRDIDPPAWARSVVYAPDEANASRCIDEARAADIVVKASGVGVLDSWLEQAVASLRSSARQTIFWDVDAPATLDRLHNDPADPFHALIPDYDWIMTYGGGDPVVEAYTALGARQCVPVYNALDPDTHHPAPFDPRFAAQLSLLANRLPDREARIDEFFFKAAELTPQTSFLLGGNGWHDKSVPSNVRLLGHVFTADHNSLNCSATLVLNVSRESMARYGFSPATRVFEAAGAGACIVSDDWAGLNQFLCPGEEILVARNGEEVAAYVESVDPDRARRIGQAARGRVLAHHTYAQRAAQVHLLLQGVVAEAGVPA